MLKHPLLYVWIVLAAMFVAAGYIRPAIEGRDQNTSKIDVSEPRGAKGAVAPAATKMQSAAQAEVQSLDCEDAGDKGDANLCLTRRATKAAELQNLINGVGLGVLAATLLATFVAAGAAWLTVGAMRDTAKRELRAYVNTVEASVARYESDYPVMQVVLKNFGQTPAYNVTAQIGVWIGKLPLDQPFPDGNANKKQSMGTIGPSSSFTARIPLRDPPLTKAMRDDVEGGACGLFLFGRVEYADAFGSLRYTNFRTVVPEDFSKDPDKSMSVCPEGNDSN